MKFTKNEKKLMNGAITLLLNQEDNGVDLEKAIVLRDKVRSLTLQTIEDLDVNGLRELVYGLMRDSADVQGCSVEDYCLANHNLEW